jgi:hypothetical protein
MGTISDENISPNLMNNFPCINLFVNIHKGSSNQPYVGVKTITSDTRKATQRYIDLRPAMLKAAVELV